MGTILPVHILGGALGLLTGFVALSALKGGTLHRRSGLLFVCAMVMLSLTGALMAAVRASAWSAANVPAGLLTAYLVITGLTTVRPFAGSRWLNIGALMVALPVGLTTLMFGVEALASGGNRNGVPAFAFLMFGVVGLLATGGDLRMMRSGSLRESSRLARHLWRMCFALFIAAASFFLGPPARVAKVIPAPLRIPALLAVPVLVPLVAMLYWQWRVRIRRSLVTQGFTSLIPASRPHMAEAFRSEQT